MKKSLLALATLTAFAGAAVAQSGSAVIMSGNIKGGVASTKYSGGATANGSGMGVNDGSSRLIIGGREDLGGGLFAVWQWDNRIRVDDNGGAGAAPTAAIPSQLGTGNTFVGLRGGFGQIRIGKLDTHYCLGSDSHAVRATALQASSCALLGFVNGSGAGQAIANASRATNIIRYDLQQGGFTGTISYSTAFQSTEGQLNADDGKAVHVQFGYAAGPMNFGVSTWNSTNETKTVGQRGATLTGGFNMGFMTLGLTYDRSSIKPSPGNRFERNVWSIPVTVPMGQGTFLATYTKASDGKSNGATVANTGATLFSMGYDYALSRRTSVGVSYASLTNKSAAAYGLYTQQALAGIASNTGGAPVAGQDQRQLYLGVRHAF
jgi:predicted porin